MDIMIETEVVAVYDLKCIPVLTGEADDIRLRLEIVRNVSANHKPLSVKVWRKENYRIMPSFPILAKADDDGYADEEILVKDVFFEGLLEGVCGNTVDEVLNHSLTLIKKSFSLGNTDENRK